MKHVIDEIGTIVYFSIGMESKEHPLTVAFPMDSTAVKSIRIKNFYGGRDWCFGLVMMNQIIVRGTKTDY